MARVCTYLNFQDCAEEAMTTYREIFGGEVVGPFVRFSDMAVPGGPELSEVDQLFAALASGQEEQPPSLMPWGQYWSVCLDRFGVRWMFASD